MKGSQECLRYTSNLHCNFQGQKTSLSQHISLVSLPEIKPQADSLPLERYVYIVGTLSNLNEVHFLKLFLPAKI